MDDLETLVSQHKWIAVAAIVIAVTVRVLKSDTKIPIDVPPRVRPWLALGLGVLSGMLDKVANGGTWTAALVGGLVSALLAMAGHDAIIGGARGGREVALPGLMIPGAAPGPGKPPSTKPPPLHRDSDSPAPTVTTPAIRPPPDEGP